MKKLIIHGKKIRRIRFRLLVGLVKIFTPRTKFVYLGDKITEPSVLLSNHAGVSAPFGFEAFMNEPLRMWGTYQMTKGYKSVKAYYTNVFLKQKHPNYSNFRCKLLGFLLSPLATLYYSGNTVIPTYPDARLKETMRESAETLDKGLSIVIFPEDSSQGYFEQLKFVFGGFAVLCERLYKKGRDVPVACCYYHKKKRVCVVDNPVKYSVFRGETFDRNALTEKVLKRINELAFVDIPQLKKDKKQ